MKVSVIICTLDKKQILRETIPSIKRSSVVDELIIVEGVRPIGYSRDMGWRKARNELICFVDDDEVIPQDWIKELAQEFSDTKIGAVWSTLAPLNPSKINELECILQNRTLKRSTLQARFVRKKAIEEIGGYEHTIGGETIYAAVKMYQYGWRIKIVDYPFFHKMHENGYAWILNIYGTGKIRERELRERRELLTHFKKALASSLRGFELSILYKEPLFLVFYPLRCWLYLSGAIYGNLTSRRTKR